LKQALALVVCLAAIWAGVMGDPQATQAAARQDAAAVSAPEIPDAATPGGAPDAHAPEEADSSETLAAAVSAPDAQGTSPDGAKTATQAAKPPPPLRLFGTAEFRCVLKDLPKWMRVMRLEKKNPSFVPGGLGCPLPQVQPHWIKLRDSLNGAPLMEKLKKVNVFFNRWPYKMDNSVWGVEDYWATPCEFMKRSGDCEDYAISKYYALRNLGVPASQMRVAAIINGITGNGHAVLVVYLDGDAYVLDNLTNMVLSHKRLSHYRPVYTVNEEYMWRHVKPATNRKK
jgi:predicted transglutaminase-like cysteine proteinase